MSKYSDQYKDPKWQKKRLEILERDEYICQSCGNSEAQLHVHHLSYLPDTKVWDYENDNFVTLCNECHTEITESIRTIINIMRGRSFSVDIITELLKLAYEIDGMNPFEIQRLCRISQIIRKGKYDE